MTDPQQDPPRNKGGRPPGFVGTVNRDIDYRCSVCQQAKPRADLVAKKISFQEIGRGGKVLKTRTQGWVCKTCVLEDPDWNKRALIDSPGMKGTRLAEQNQP